MPGTSVVLGPFSGGINTQSDPSMVSDRELVDCVNMEVDLDGSLKSRPPVVRLADTPIGGRMLLLGFAYLMEGTYLIGSNSGGVWSRNAAGVWNQITSTIQSTSMVQFRNQIWLPAKPGGSASPGGWWHPNSGWNPIAAMPPGNSILVHKGRLYIAPGLTAPTNRSRIYYSGADATGTLDPTIWNLTDLFVDVNEGDGQILVDIIVFNDSIVCLKQDSTYVFAFDTSPKQGVIRKLSGTIGVTRDHCVALYENNMYIYHSGEVYEVVNFDFARINAKVPFLYDSTAAGTFAEDVFLTFFADRLLVRYYNKVYAFGMRTRAWTTWETPFYFGPIIPGPIQATGAINDIFYAGSCLTNENRWFQMNDGYDAVQAEEMNCTAKTKNYDMGSSFRYKRLFYWGCDILSVDDVTGIITPVVAPISIPAPNPPDINDIQLVGTGGTGSPLPVRSFLKFLKALRFRQVNFQVKMTTNGTISRGPVRLFGLTAFVKSKEHAVKEAS